MKFKTVIRSKRFWPSVFIMMLAFIVFYNIIMCGLEFKFDFGAFIQNRYVENNVFRSILANLIGGFLYGFIVVFLQFRAKIKRENRAQQ